MNQAAYRRFETGSCFSGSSSFDTGPRSSDSEGSMTVQLLLIVIAFALFVLATIGWPVSRFNLILPAWRCSSSRSICCPTSAE